MLPFEKLETTTEVLRLARLRLYEGNKMKRTTTIRQYTTATVNMDAIRKIAANEKLTEAEVFDFPKFVICRSGKNYNNTDITGDGQKAAVDKWIGKPIYYKDHETEAPNQIGRIYETWIEEANGETITYGRGFGVKTNDLADVYKRIQNRIHSEMSCAYEPEKSLCSQCKSDIDLTSNHCECGHTIGEDGVYALDIAFNPDHISFVGRPAVQGAGTVTCACKVADEPPPIPTAYLATLERDAADGRVLREFTQREFTKYYAMNHRDVTPKEVKDLADKLTAKEMMQLSRIEQERMKEIMPGLGKQMSVVAPEKINEFAEPLDWKTIGNTIKEAQTKG